MRVALLSREFPPEVYGGAGVHVEYLARHLDRLVDVEVHAFGEPRSSPLVAGTYRPWPELGASGSHAAALDTLSVDLAMAARVGDVDVVHSHTWYTNVAGHLVSLIHGTPLVVTAHSLEPLRPWKAEQLGGGYAVAGWCERTGMESAAAVIAVSHGMRDDVLRCYPQVDPDVVHVVHNGIDTDEYRPVPDTDRLVAHGIDPERPYVLFVGRITHQKGVTHLLDAVALLEQPCQVVLCAGQPDTPEIGAEVSRLVDELSRTRDDVIWIDEMLPRPAMIQLMTHAAVFVCPSVYEPFGLINVEAMACETPVVASAVGGIPEIVVDGTTGRLVEFEPGSSAVGSPADPARFASDLAAAIDDVLGDPDRAQAMGRAGRQRVLEHFAWPTIAERTVELYRSLV
ncbi:MAG: glycogen synthase [Acidimicrobiales bacterium]